MLYAQMRRAPILSARLVKMVATPRATRGLAPPRAHPHVTPDVAGRWRPRASHASSCLWYALAYASPRGSTASKAHLQCARLLRFGWRLTRADEADASNSGARLCDSLRSNSTTNSHASPRRIGPAPATTPWRHASVSDTRARPFPPVTTTPKHYQGLRSAHLDMLSLSSRNAAQRHLAMPPRAVCALCVSRARS